MFGVGGGSSLSLALRAGFEKQSPSASLKESLVYHLLLVLEKSSPQDWAKPADWDDTSCIRMKQEVTKAVTPREFPSLIVVSYRTNFVVLATV